MTIDGLDENLHEIFTRLWSELVHYTPEHFKDVFCFIEEGVEDNEQALFYHIGSPNHPDERTTNPNPRLHEVAWELLEYWEQRGESFPGFKLVCIEDKDGNWKYSAERLDIGTYDPQC